MVIYLVKEHEFCSDICSYIVSYRLRNWTSRVTGMHACFPGYRVSHTHIIIIITSSDDIQPSTLISDQSPSGLLLDINVTGILLLLLLYNTHTVE